MRGLYGQLMAVTSAVLVVAVGISLWVLYTFGVSAAVNQTRTRTEAAVATAARGVYQALQHQSYVAAPMAKRPMRRLERALGGTLQVVNAQGSTYFHMGGAATAVATAGHLPRPGQTQRVDLQAGALWVSRLIPQTAFTQAQRTRLFVVWRVPIVPPAFPTPTQVGVMISGLAAIVLAQILWALVARRLTGPLAALLAQLDRYGQGDFTARAEIRSPAEFARLAEATTRMGEALAAERTAREAFLAEVAHDLRTPLTALRGLLGSLRSQTGADPAVAGDRLGRAEREAERLTRLVNDLLDLARYESGHLAVDLGPIDLREVAMLGAVSGEAASETRGVRFDVEQPAAPVWVRGNLDRGAQVLVNLVDNAIRYTPAGGHVTVRVLEEQGAGILRVEDTGPGFEAGAADWAWSAFTRGKAARENDGGTGLGLAVGRVLADVMQGRLEILPAMEGWGGRVQLRLPSVNPDAAPYRQRPRADAADSPVGFGS